MPLPQGFPDLASLDLLLRVAELGSVGKAAAAHGISQPSASARLNRLERQVGVALLTRSPTGTTLTPSGAAFAAWASDVVRAAEVLDANVATLRETRSARLRVAASLTIAEYLLPSWLLLLRRRDPGLEVSVAVANSQDVAERVRAGDADLGFVESPSAPPGLGARQVGVDRLTLVAAPDYPAARRTRTALRARDLLDLPLLLRERGSGTRDAFVVALADALGRSGDAALPHHATELGSTATILATARAGGGIGVISTRAADRDIAAGTLVAIDVPGLRPQRPLSAVWAGRTPGRTAQQLIELAEAAADED